MSIKYRCRLYKYQLAEDYDISLPELSGIKLINEKTEYFNLYPNGRLFIKTGYAWDGPSGPTIDSKDFMRGSLVHDVLYQAIRLGFLPVECKDIADDILRRICREDGMSAIRAWWVWRAVRRFGASACEPGSDQNEILEAP